MHVAEKNFFRKSVAEEKRNLKVGLGEHARRHELGDYVGQIVDEFRHSRQLLKAPDRLHHVHM